MRTEHNYIRTYTGRKFWPLDPDSSDVAVEDIAHALSQLCRFTGHTREFYSVAQHSVLASKRLEAVSADHAMFGLLHDASEAYLLDLARPVKHDPAMTFYRVKESILQRVIYNAFALFSEEPPEVKAVDELLLHCELRDLMTGSHPAHAARAGTEPQIRPINAKVAKLQFLEQFTRLNGPTGRYLKKPDEPAEVLR